MMKKIRFFCPFFIAFALILHASAFPLQRAKGGVVCLLADINPSADPLSANSPADYDIARACYITLFELGPDSVPQPYLCRDFRLNRLRSELSLILHDAGFSNGRRITTGDCIFTIERAVSRRPDLRLALRSIEGVDNYVNGVADEISGLAVVSETGLVISMVSPELASELLRALCNPALGILSRSHYQVVGKKYFNAPVTSGPFTLTRSRDGIILTPQPNFPFSRPWLDSVTIKHGAGEAAHLEFSVGAADVLEAPPEYYRQYNDDYNLTGHIAEKGILLEYFLLLNPAVPPLNESKVRWAIRLAIDNTGLTEVTLGGAALDTYRLPKDVVGVEYRGRVEAAKAALAGYGDLNLHPVRLGYPSDDGRAALMAERIAVNIEPLGIKTVLQPVADFGSPGVELKCGMMLMPVPFLDEGDLNPQLVIDLAGSWGFGGDALSRKASEDSTAAGCCLPLLRPQRLVVTAGEFLPPILGPLGEIDFYRLSLG